MAIAQSAPGHWLPWARFRDAILSGTRQTPAALGAEIFEYYGTHPEEAAAFSGAMEGLSAMVASEVAENVDTHGVVRVVDVGGANGTLLSALLSANGALSGTLLDLPHVVAGATAALTAAGLAGRCEVVAGDFFESVPEGDLYLLKQILHDWDDAQCRTILASCARPRPA
jgi:O-methyltransferase domain